MKLIIAILSNKDAYTVLDELLIHELKVTKISSTGGFLKSGNTTLLCGVEEEGFDETVGIIRNVIQTKGKETDNVLKPIPLKVSNVSEIIQGTIGRATIFTLNVERFERF